MSRSHTILRNIASNWIGFAVNALVTLFLTPFVLSSLGTARYGIWVLTASVIGYYGLLDLGFRAGVTQYLTRYLALKDYRSASESLSSALLALTSLGALMLLLSMIAASAAPVLFELPDDTQREAFWCILIVGLTSAIQCAFFPFAAIFPATQRFDLANLIGVSTRLLTAAAIVAALKAGYGLIGVSIATCGSSLVDYLIRWRVARRLVPGLPVSIRIAKLSRLKEIGAFGTWNFLISICTYVELHAQTLVLGAVMPIAAVGYYALATGLAQQLNAVLTPVGQVIYPAATELHVRGERKHLERLYRDGSRFILLAAVSLALIAAFWAVDFYRLWIGSEYVSGETFPSVARLLQLLLLALVAGYTSNIAGQILLGAGLIRLLALCLVCGAVLNLTLMLVLVRPYGLIGVALAYVCSSGLVNLVVTPLVVQRMLGLRVRDLYLGAWLRAAASGLALAVVLVGIRATGPARDWQHFILQGVAAGAAAVTVALVLGVTAEERDRFLWQPLRRLAKRRERGEQPTT